VDAMKCDREEYCACDNETLRFYYTLEVKRRVSVGCPSKFCFLVA